MEIKVKDFNVLSAEKRIEELKKTLQIDKATVESYFFSRGIDYSDVSFQHGSEKFKYFIEKETENLMDFLTEMSVVNLPKGFINVSDFRKEIVEYLYLKNLISDEEALLLQIMLYGLW